jgi:hypothetical protein
MSFTDLNDSQRRAIEAYLLADTDNARTQALNELVPGSQMHYYMYFMDRFRRVGASSPLSKQEKSVLEEFGKAYRGSKEYEEISARLLLCSYDSAKSGAEKEQVLKRIKERYLTDIEFNHERPEGVNLGESHGSSN